MQEYLPYFRQVVTDPTNAEPWSRWWLVNEESVQRTLPLMEYVRLKHRRVRGAREILQRAGELPPDFRPPDPLLTGICVNCGECVARSIATSGEATAQCPRCGPLPLANMATPSAEATGNDQQTV